MVIRELFVKLGLKEDSASFAEGFATVELLKKGLEIVADKASEAVRFLKEQVKATSEAGEEAKLMAQRLGVSVEAVQELGYIGKLTNVELGEMALGFRKLAQAGHGDLKKGFEDLAERITHAHSAGAKLALATENLGRAGNKLLPILNKGRAGIRELMEEAQRLGGVMSKEDVQAASEYEESTRKLSFALTGLRNAVIIPLLKPLTDLVNLRIRHVAALAQEIKGINSLTTHLKALAITVVAAAVAWGAYVAVGQLATVVTLGGAAAFGAMATAIWSAVTAVAAFLAPILGVVAALGALYLLIDDIVVFFENGDSLIGRNLRKWVGPFKTWQEALHLVWEKIKEGLINAFHTAVDSIKALLNGLWTEVQAGIKKLPGVEMFLNHVQAAGTAAGSGAGIAGTVGAFFTGGANSPSAAAANSARGGSKAVVNIANMHVNSNHGESAEDIAGKVPKAIQDHLDRTMREAAAAAGS